MIYLEEKFKLDYSKVDAPDLDHEAFLKVFIPNTENEVSRFSQKRPTVLVLPGGGYCNLSEREGEPIAMKYLARGFNVCVLYYAVQPNVFPVALLEALTAIKYIRDNSERFFADPDRIFVCGFSAGGHLTASVGTLWHEKESVKYFGDTEAVKPNGLILSYPVITGKKNAHRGSFDALIGKKEGKEELIEYLSLENRVSEKTPPCFIWHTFEDTCVPCENSLIFSLELRKYNIPFELHIFENGNHGLATANLITNEKDFPLRTQGWIDMSADWILKK